MGREIRLLSIVTRMNVGGPAVQISSLMRSFLGTRVYQVLLTGTTSPDEMDYLALHGSDLRFMRISSLQREVSARKDLQALARITHFILGFQPDVIHTHTAKAGTLGRLAAIITRSQAKRVHTFHGHLLHGYFTERQTQNIVRVESHLARRTDRLIAVGARVRDDLLAVGIGHPRQYSVVAPGVSLGSLKPRWEVRESQGLSQEAFVVCFVGRLTQIKRIDRLVEVIRLVERIHPQVHFVIAGDGEEARLLESARDKEGLPITLLGWQRNIEDVLACSDAMILTSDNEGTPVALIQAGLAGLPVVATDVGSVSDVVTHGKSGLLTPTAAPALASALIQLIQNSTVRHNLGKFAKHDYGQRYSAEVLAKAHLEVYDEILSTR